MTEPFNLGNKLYPPLFFLKCDLHFYTLVLYILRLLSPAWYDTYIILTWFNIPCLRYLVT